MRLDVDPYAVEREIARYVTSGERSTDAVAVALRHHVLPIWTDLGGCVALRVDGTLVSLGWDEPSVELVAQRHPDGKLIHAARGHASQLFPELAGLAPIRTASSKVCPTCGGAGRPADWQTNVICECGGLGWLP